MATKAEKLTEKGEQALALFMAELFKPKLGVASRKTKKPVVIAMVGLPGSGKSSVAKVLAERIGGAVIEADRIRIALRKVGERYEQARIIADRAAIEVLHHGGNPILDSDFVDADKRAALKQKVRKMGAQVLFVRTMCDMDVMLGRMITADYADSVEDFFGGAGSKYQGTPKVKGAVVKIREMERRIPLHCRQTSRHGNTSELKNMPWISTLIDTTDEKRWRWEAEMYAGILKK